MERKGNGRKFSLSIRHHFILCVVIWYFYE